MRPVESTSNNSSSNGARKESDRQLSRHIAKFLVDSSTHNCFGKDMEQIRTYSENSLYPSGHKGRGDDKPATRTDTSCDKPGSQTDCN